MNYKLVFGWLYPELMSTYGDRGNIIVLQKRCEWRGIDVEIKRLDLRFKIEDLKKCDLLFMGGAQDRQQQIVAKDLMKKQKVLQDRIEDGIPGLYVCGAYQFLGKHYKEANGTVIDGLNILDLYTENPGDNHERLIGNIVVEIPRNVILGSAATPESPTAIGDSGQARTTTFVGFENHGGRTYLGKNLKPLGKVIKGFGNNGIDKTEGAIYRNSFGTYLHGPILPKNPKFADLLIRLALEKKYPPSGEAGKKSLDPSPLDDSLENQASTDIMSKI